MFLYDVKVGILLISWHFLMFFLCDPHHPFTAALISVQMEGVEVVHIWAKFYLDMTYVFDISKI